MGKAMSTRSQLIPTWCMTPPTVHAAKAISPVSAAMLPALRNSWEAEAGGGGQRRGCRSEAIAQYPLAFFPTRCWAALCRLTALETGQRRQGRHS